MLEQFTHRSLPHHGCLIKDYRERHSEPHLPEEELEQSHSLFLWGLQGNWIYPSPMRGFPRGMVVQNPPVNAGDVRGASSIPGSGRSSEVENGNPLQYSYLENLMDGGN